LQEDIWKTPQPLQAPYFNMGFARLPNDILLEIGHVCTVQSLSPLRAVNHYFHDLFSDIFCKKFAIPAWKDVGVLSDNPAWRAIVNDWTLVLKRLLGRGLDANTFVDRESEGVRDSLLHIAVAHGIKPAVESLLEFGADIDALDGHGWSPLMHACLYGHLVQMVRLLLENGANINGADEG
jgi:ankyrin repeat protein